ncbi:hypothetical protein SAMN05428949_4415 [Chitinophaga sp. YR627]|jgi:hypothetical protein|uniref:Uncharacterized protein n=1 Tax=Chitinophaga pinensis (strain ATCC 43595 / DSM 2588 / LMG 13176 / NBRC 15968 / NCIMB 11800 / UQM 2034) TaxID=485918 RepID=A0A979GC37_CHIPD|nr:MULTISPECIES: DUF6728 family protein [Chitinophaga]ACU64457.1 hypothetical protein Cpin_7056 [Chitinophaga pinensis DSM 2588]SFO19416.1 hypothetical protein SAMN05428949_4415 [Chitinophaga sp. YR627]
MKSIWQQILRYLYIGKKDPSAPQGRYVSMMHGMNRISIIVFLIALIIMLVKLFTRHH